MHGATGISGVLRRIYFISAFRIIPTRYERIFNCLHVERELARVFFRVDLLLERNRAKGDEM